MVTTDASNVDIGAVLQKQSGDQLLTVAFVSRTLSPADRRCSAGHREALASLFVVGKWHVYLWGRNFTLRTDNQVLNDFAVSWRSGATPLANFSMMRPAVITFLYNIAKVPILW